MKNMRLALIQFSSQHKYFEHFSVLLQKKKNEFFWLVQKDFFLSVN